MNVKLLQLLMDRDDYVSGEEISNMFNVSRSAIWKQIKVLKEAGYEIEGISKKGYKLLSKPDIINQDIINSKLNTELIGRNIYYYDKLSSTNEIAKTLADEAKDGSLVISEKQIGGKGRLGRTFESPLGGVWMSIILKPNIEPENASKLTQLAGASLITLLKNMGINSLIKWPNDIYVNGKKICGILTEMKCDMDEIHYLIVGIGINVNFTIEKLPEELHQKATSLKTEFNRTYDRNEFIANFLNIFESYYNDLVVNDNYRKVVKICQENSIILNKEAYLITPKNKEKVQCIGINDDGCLIVRTETGETKKVISGEITFH